MSISMKRYNDTIITPKDDRILFDQIFDDYGLIYGGSATMAASNKIHVGAARGFIKGTEVIVEAEDIAVNLSDSGTKNGRLKIVMDLADTETPIKFESEVAASFPALEQDANINYDNGRYEVVFATYKATETTISSVALVMPTMQSVKAKIQGINQSLTLLNEGIQAVSKKQNFCKGSDRLLTDVLQIDFTNPTGESNSYGVIATEDASKLLNSPVTDGAFYAYREVLTIKSVPKDYKVIVRLTEAYPSPGRTWIKAYNPNISDWSDWKVI